MRDEPFFVTGFFEFEFGELDFFSSKFVSIVQTFSNFENVSTGKRKLKFYLPVVTGVEVCSLGVFV